MKTIESKIAPNPKEAQIWVDLSADPNGGISKIFSGGKWTATESNKKPTYSKKEMDALLAQKVNAEDGKGLSSNDFTDDEKRKLSTLKNYNDTDLRRIIQVLLKRIEKIEESLFNKNHD